MLIQLSKSAAHKKVYLISLLIEATGKLSKTALAIMSLYHYIRIIFLYHLKLENNSAQSFMTQNMDVYFLLSSSPLTLLLLYVWGLI